MVTRDTAWPPGTPCWIDLMTSDPAAARDFYGALFGWQLEVGPPETGGYTMCFVEGRPAAGIGPIPEGQSFPPSWTTYLATADADECARAIEKAGGMVLNPPFDVLLFGRMAVAQPGSGGVFGIWQAGSHSGIGISNEPNALTWNEFMTRDYEGAKAFYAEVFGYGYSEVGGDDVAYAMIELDGRTIGGLGELPAEVPPEIPPHWRVYFAVDDADAVVARAAELGGTVARPPQDMPYGRHADLADPQGAMFSIITPAAASS